MPRPPRSDLPRPFLKWAGGKTQLLGQFQALYPPPAAGLRYLEPFVGSAAVFFHVRRILAPQAAILSDGNPALVEVYTAVRDDVEGVIRRLAGHARRHGEVHYYRVRAQASARLGPAARAARLIYLNRTCFNGLYRVNSRGRFNVPMGRYRRPRILDEANLRAVSGALRGVEIRAAHFRETVETARRGDFVYFDPPYHPLSSTASFTSYTAASFTGADQEELAAVFAALDRKGCRAMLSNSDTDLIRRLYRSYRLVPVRARRSINSRADRRGPIGELVVLNYEPGVRPTPGLPLSFTALETRRRPASAGGP